MATHTLTGNLTGLIGTSLSTTGRATARAYVVPFSQATVESDEVRLGAIELTLDAAGAFIQAGLAEGGYRVECRYYDAAAKQVRIWSSSYFALDADIDLADAVAAEPFEEGLRILSIGSVTTGVSPDVNLSDAGVLDFVLPDVGGTGNVLFEDGGTYPDRALEDANALFVGTIDPGPDGLDLMVDGDVWLDTTGTDSLADHLADTTDAHDASAISFVPNGSIAATNVQAAIQEVRDEAVGGGSSGILAVTAYNPGTISSVNIASATVTDVDATNLAVTFTVPASGKVLVRLSALVTLPGSLTSNVMNWHLRESTTTLDTQDVGSSATQFNIRATAEFLITGLTPAASKTYKWAHSRANAGTGTTHAGGIAGAAVMTVIAAP